MPFPYDTTDNHDLPQIDPLDPDSEDQWGQVLNDQGWARLDEKLIARDELANIDQFTPYDGAIFWATDSGEPIFEGDGAEWTLANMEVDTLTASAVSAGELNNTYYSSHYGADGAAIQAALDETSGTQWSRVVVDPIDTSPYAVGDSAPLEIPSKTVVVIREDVKLADDTPENVIQNENFEDDDTDDESIIIRFEGGEIDGNRLNNTGGDAEGATHAGGFYQNGICFLGVHGVVIQDPIIKGPNTHGIMLGACERVRVRGGEIIEPHASAVQAHFRESDSTINKDVGFEGVTTRDGGSSDSGAFRFSGFEDAWVRDCTVYSHGAQGVTVVDGDAGLESRNCTVQNVSVFNVAGGSDGAQKTGILIITTSSSPGPGLRDVNIDGCTVETGNNHAVTIQSRESPIENVNISDCTLESYGNVVRIDESYDGTPGISNVTIDGRTSITVGSVPQSDASGVYINGGVGDGYISAYVTGCPGSGIRFSPTAATGKPVGWLVDGSALVDNDNYGVRVGSGKDIRVESNEFRGNNRPVYEDEYADDCVYLYNDWRNEDNGPTFDGVGTITDPVNQDTTEDYNLS